MDGCSVSRAQLFVHVYRILVSGLQGEAEAQRSEILEKAAARSVSDALVCVKRVCWPLGDYERLAELSLFSFCFNHLAQISAHLLTVFPLT